MELIRCEYGHYFDPSRHKLCPHCETYGRDDEPGYTVAKVADVNKGVPSGVYAAPEEPQDPATVALAKESMGFDPPTGWLVCISGAARGQQYIVRTERNSIGRGDKMSICIKGDLGISRENHATLSYNPRARTFTLIPGEGKAILYLNGQELLGPAQLRAYDRIEVSATVLIFVPLCSETFSWDDNENNR